MIWEGFDRFDQHVEEIVIEDYSDLMMGGFVRDSKQLRLLSLYLIEARRNIMGS